MEQAQQGMQPGDLSGIKARESWVPHPSSRVATAHKILGFLYLLPAVAYGVAAVLADSPAHAGGMAAVVCLLLAMAGLHFLLLYGARHQRGWSRLLSIFVGLCLLLAVPIGTIFGVVILINASKSWK